MIEESPKKSETSEVFNILMNPLYVSEIEKLMMNIITGTR